MSAKERNPQAFEGIAVIGMQGRFPGARSVSEFWENLKNGVESITTFTDDELQAAGIDPSYRSSGYVNRGCTLDEIDQFDAGFFGYSARDAETIDPQQRVFIECAWEALEQAGYDPESYPGLIGLFAGSDQSSYLYQIYANVDLSAYGYGGMMSIGNEKDYLTTQASYKLNLRGPSMAVQTSCSTSLVAICVACQNLRHGYCDMALAGGAAISVPQKRGYWYQQGGILSPDGRCRPFDANGQGTVVGNGVGVVLLKRLPDAMRDGDNILAVIKGFALNNDGSAKVGYTAPSVEGQSQVIRFAQRMAQVEPQTIGYIEAHGTATALGDPVEVAALTKSFRERTQATQFCGIGSVKSNVGHLSSAAGVTGFIKSVLTVQHAQIPPTLHYEQPNPQLNLERTPFFVASKLMDWPIQGSPRRAGVSSFGVGGTNAHIVVEQAPKIVREAPVRGEHILVLSARTATALEKMTDNLVAHLEASPEINLTDMEFTLQAGRRVFPHRRAIVFRHEERASLPELLRRRDPQRLSTVHSEIAERSVVFMFSGQGTQYAGMGLELYTKEPVFRQWMDRCAEVLTEQIGLDIRNVLFEAADEVASAEKLKQTEITQPVLFALEYSLARLWLSWGVRPRAMLGHSIGEYVAACLAGVFTLEEALSVVAMRGRLMGAMPGGSMLAVPLPESVLQPLLQHNISLAAVNAPSMAVLAGPTPAIAALEKQLAAQGITTRLLQTSHAFHSSMMDPVLAQFTERLRRIDLKAPRVPYLSNVTGTWMTPELAVSPEYWAHHLRQTVRFADNLREVMAFPDLTLLEVGAGQTLGLLARQQGTRAMSQLIVSSLPSRPEKQQVSDNGHIAATVSQMWLGGVRFDWRGFHAGEQVSRIPMPTYPFEKRRYWLGSLEELNGSRPQADATESLHRPVSGTVAPAVAVSSTTRRSIEDWFYVPLWKPSVKAPLSSGAAEQWLVFSDRSGLGGEIVEKLQVAGHQVSTVTPGKKFVAAEGRYEIRIDSESDYKALIQDLKQGSRYPSRILHLWSVDAESTKRGVTDRFDASQTRSFYSAVHVAQALAKASATAAVEVGIVTDSLQSVIGDETLRSHEAAVLGIAKVISQEYPNLRFRCIDIVPSERPAAALIGELTKEPFDAVVAYRKGKRWIESYEPVSLPPADAVPQLNDGDVCWITGGLGNIALLLAEAIASRAKVHFVLMGRSSFPARADWERYANEHPSDGTSTKIQRLLALEKNGSDFLVLQADAVDRTQMQAAVKQAVEKWGKIDGVIHGAANLSPDAFRPMGNIDRANGDGHLRPKMHGILLLEELLADQPVKFWFLLSSLSAVLGGLGLGSYAASNACLDALARRRNAEGRATWISVNWDAWDFTSRDEKAIGSSEGQDCFNRIMASSLRQVVVSTTALSERLSRWVEMRKTEAPKVMAAAQSGSASVTVPAAGQTHERPNLSTSFVSPSTETERTVSQVWEHLLGVAPIGVHDKFFELGGHSLLAIQVLAQLRETFDIDLPVQQLFESPTVAQLSASIDKQRSERPAASTAGDAELDEMVQMMEGLSEAEIEALLKEAESPQGKKAVNE